MTTQDLNSKLTSILKKQLIDEQFVSSGKLLKSIKFNTTFANNKLSMNLNALDYIQYLDDGKFIKRFYDKKEVLDLIQEFYVDNLTL